MNWIEFGTPEGIRTPDLRRERAMSWAARRRGHRTILSEMIFSVNELRFTSSAFDSSYWLMTLENRKLKKDIYRPNPQQWDLGL